MNISRSTREGAFDALAAVALVILLLNLIHYLTKVVPVTPETDPFGARVTHQVPTHARSHANCNPPHRGEK
jgi:hypothetical protein